MEGQEVGGGAPFASRRVRSGHWLIGGFAALAFIVSGVIRMMGDVWVPVASLSALLLLASKPFADRAMRKDEVPRGEVVAALAMLGACPLLLLGALYAMAEPIISSHWRCGTGTAGSVAMAPFAFVILGGLSGLAAMVVVRRERPWVSALVRGMSLLAIVAATALAVMAFARREGRTDADHYQASLEVAGTVPPVSGEPVEVHAATFQWQKAPIKVYDASVDRFVVRRLCMNSYCDVMLGFAGEPWPESVSKVRGAGVEKGATLVLKRDVAHDVFVLEGGWTQVAFRGKELELADVRIADVKDTLAPPLGWSVGAAAGVAIALFLQLWRVFAKRRLGRLAGAKTGAVGENGWISFEDETPALRADNIAVGPVLVLFGEGSRGDAYRGEGPRGVVEILSGSREEIFSRARSELLAIDALSLSSVMLTAMPLVASAVVGILI